MVIWLTIRSAIRKIKSQKKGTKSFCSSSSKPSPSYSPKDAASFSKVKTCTWKTKYNSTKANVYGWHVCSKLKKFNKSVPKDKGTGKALHVAKYNLDSNSKVEDIIH
jgi:hypothetical protein